MTSVSLQVMPVHKATVILTMAQYADIVRGTNQVD
jgi:hypothetical protein